MFPNLVSSPYLVFLSKVLVEAGKELLRLRDSGSIRVYSKSKLENNFNQEYTDHDTKVQDFVIQRIRNTYPDHNICSEELKSNDFKPKSTNWILDPIDGTINYIRDFDRYSISLAYWQNGSTKAAGVFAPYSNRLYLAEEGKGSFLNGKKLKCSRDTEKLSSIILSSGLKSFQHANEDSKFYKLLDHFQNTRIFSSSVLDICDVASARCEARVLADAKIWDLAAASLILKESGGRVTNWQGVNDKYFSSAKIIASNGFIHASLISLLND